MTMLLKRLITLVLVSLLTLGMSLPARADTTSPDQILASAADRMIDALNKDRVSLKGDPKRVRELVENELLPYVDVIGASSWVLGKYWRGASKEQKLGFIREFRTLLLRFYSNALAEYLDTSGDKLIDRKTIVFHPLRANPGDTDVVVRSEVKQDNGKTMPVLYSMHQTASGWKVYDVTVEGVSVITTYRTSFADEIRQNGIDSLIQSLNTRNENLLKDVVEKGKKKAS